MKGPVAVAVSGGSDSLALLLETVCQVSAKNVVALTVDHQLRPESADEAEFVAEIASSLGVRHHKLVWNSGGAAASTNSRLARYELLAECASAEGAAKVLLGHTMDDQAETIVMRAARLTDESSTRGLAGMAASMTFDGMRFERPMLGTRRVALQDRLRRSGQTWVDDPSNHKMSSERVRVRTSLGDHNWPIPPKQLVRLGALVAQQRLQDNCICARWMRTHVPRTDDGLALCHPRHWPQPALSIALGTLIRVVGQRSFGPSSSQLSACLDAVDQGRSKQHALGGVLLTFHKKYIHLQPERRRRAHSVVVEPSLRPFERFRPDFDDPLYEALLKLTQPSEDDRHLT